MANGPLHRPKLPGIPGIEAFQGHTFHTSRWDYDYTGGDSDGNLTGLHGKRIGITGTGATAVQRMPDLGESAEHLYVFQRTPSSIDVRNNRPTDPEWAASLGPGWQKRRIDNFNTLVSGGYKAEDMVNDGWTNIIDKLLITVRKAEGAADLSAEGLARTAELADFEKMEQIRGRVETIVNDPSTGRGPEAVLPPALQAAVLPRRVPRHLQPAQRHPRRHAGQGCGAHHRAGHRRQWRRVRDRLSDLRDGIRTIEASEEAESAWVERIVELALNNQKFLAACTPSYYNNEGPAGGSQHPQRQLRRRSQRVHRDPRELA